VTTETRRGIAFIFLFILILLCYYCYYVVNKQLEKIYGNVFRVCRGCNTRAVLSQEGPRDAAVHFDIIEFYNGIVRFLCHITHFLLIFVRHSRCIQSGAANAHCTLGQTRATPQCTATL